MGKRFYKFAGAMIRTFSHRMKTEWEVPFEEGPCVFVVNHVGAIGPVDMCTKFPMRDRCHPWINNGMLEAKEVPAYVRQDYWWKPGNFFEPVLNVTVPYFAAAVIPPILRSVQYIPVYHDQRIMLTLRQWLRLGELWYRASGRAMKMYPVHIDREKRTFRVAAPVWYDPARRFADQEKELADRLAKGLRGE